MPDFRDFIGKTSVLQHSAKGSTWEDHKYIKRVDGTYYYPDSYEGGRHLNDEKSEEKKFDSKKAATEMNKYMKQLSDTGKFNMGTKDEWEAMTLDEFKKLYSDVMGRDSKGDLSDAALKEMFEHTKAQNTGKEKPGSDGDLSDKDVENLAKEVVGGKFGDGQVRKDLLGKDYQKVQDKVNEIMKSNKLKDRKVSADKEEKEDDKEKEVKKKVSKATKTIAEKGLKMDSVYSVYKRKKK